MIKQMFKLIWNRKRRNALMIIGIFISFFSLFLVLTAVNYNLGNYLKPLGFDYENVWFLNIDWKNQERQEIEATLRQINIILDGQPEIINHSYSISYLFMPSATSMNDFEYNGKKVTGHVFQAGDQFADVLKIDLQKGRWFDRQDDASPYLPIVINRKMVEEFFPDSDPLGQIVQQEDTQCQVVGVIDEFRNGGEFTGTKKIVISRAALGNPLTDDFVNEVFFIRILLRVRPGTTMEFEERLLNQVNAVARDWMITAARLADKRKSANAQSMILPVVMAIICGFLIINVALGLFGIIWYNTNQRKAEIGLRRAMGSTVGNIYRQIVGEAMVLTTFGVIAGIILAVQFPILELIPFIPSAVYLSALVFAIMFIYLITVVCALYPSRLAAGIEPAMALHEE